MNLAETYRQLKARGGQTYWESRIVAELGFLINLTPGGDARQKALEAEAARLLDAAQREGVISEANARLAEDNLAGFAGDAKKIVMHLAAHAHIDMNWMWGFQETVGITLDTFRTMLNLMDEYPDFTFSQSQASTYRIVEEYAPDMLTEIARRVREGRWELSAGAWVETDKNMPDGESLARHILYTKEYLSKLFGVAQDSLEVDYQPDTFGHNANVPEILRAGGLKFYYHCRGYDGHIAYRWRAPSGAEVLVWREPHWYLGGIAPDVFADAPAVARDCGSDALLWVYGVGDHGGGPTRRDLDRLLDMRGWPLYPALKFSTYHAFFHELEKVAGALPLVEGELNPIFTGCYTSQSRIKMANRFGEARLRDTEALDSMAALAAPGYKPASSLNGAWEKLLFNHFHDIIPGSGTVETREYAMGEFQKVLAAANTNAGHAMRAVAAALDTVKLTDGGGADGLSEGAGVGFGLGQSSGFRFPATERGMGDARLITVFNPTQYGRNEVMELTVWDWLAGREKLTDRDIIAADAQGAEAAAQVLSPPAHYWGHTYVKLALAVSVPAFGYATYVLRPREAEAPQGRLKLSDPRVEAPTDENLVLENQKLRAVFDPVTMRLVSLLDKTRGCELADAARPGAYFRLTTENAVRGMTSWTVGRAAAVRVLNDTEPVNIMEVSKGALRQSVRYTVAFGRSKLSVTVSLDEHSSTLSFNAEADWHEVGGKETGIPALSFAHPLPAKTDRYAYDIPFGVIERASLASDMPGNSFISAGLGAAALTLTTDSKYGYRGFDDTLAVNLIRSSFDPDPYPEYGVHHIRIGLAASAIGAEIEQAARFSHPLCYAPNTRHAGALPADGSLLSVEGRVQVSAVKTAEDGAGRVIRLYNAADTAQDAVLRFNRPARAAERTDINERPISGVTAEGGEVRLTVGAKAVATLRVTF